MHSIVNKIRFCLLMPLHFLLLLLRFNSTRSQTNNIPTDVAPKLQPSTPTKTLYPIAIQNTEFDVTFTSPPSDEDTLDLLQNMKALCYQKHSARNAGSSSKQCVTQAFDRFVLAVKQHEQEYLQQIEIHNDLLHMSLPESHPESSPESPPESHSESPIETYYALHQMNSTDPGIQQLLQKAQVLRTEQCTPNFQPVSQLWTVETLVVTTPPYQIKQGTDGWCVDVNNLAVHQLPPSCGRVCSSVDPTTGTITRGVYKEGTWSTEVPCSACPAAEWPGCPKAIPNKKYENIHLGGGSSILKDFLNIDVLNFNDIFRSNGISILKDLNIDVLNFNDIFRSNRGIQTYHQILQVLHSQKLGDVLYFPDINANDNSSSNCQYMKHDLSNPIQPLPNFATGSVKLLYSEHFIEHVPHDQLVRILKDVRRILVNKGQGVARFSTPDLRLFIDSYLYPDKENGWFDQHKKQLTSIMDSSPEFLGYWGRKRARMTHVLNDLFHNWGHDKGFLYDYEEFYQTALEAGFDDAEITRVQFHRPANSSLAHLDNYWRRIDSFYVELRNLES